MEETGKIIFIIINSTARPLEALSSLPNRTIDNIKGIRNKIKRII